MVGSACDLLVSKGSLVLGLGGRQGWAVLRSLFLTRADGCPDGHMGWQLLLPARERAPSSGCCGARLAARLSG